MDSDSPGRSRPLLAVSHSVPGTRRLALTIPGRSTVRLPAVSGRGMCVLPLSPSDPRARERRCPPWPPHSLRTAPAVLDDAHVGDIRGALGTIRPTTPPAARPVRQAEDAAGDRRPRPDRDVRRQRRGRLLHLRAGRAELRHPAAVDAAAADPRALREPGDGAAARRGHRGRARPADPGAVREVLGRVLSVIDLFLLNALTIVTEFIGITLAAGYLGRAQAGRGAAGARPSILAAASTGASGGSSGSR